jgi:hypothetical protein
MNRFSPPEFIGVSRLHLALAALALVGTVAVPARAEEPPPIDMSEAGDGSGTAQGATAPEPTESISYPKAFNDRPLTAPAGLVMINFDAGVNLSKDYNLKPVYLTPDLYYGVNPDLTVGLVHHAFVGFPYRGSLCLGGLTRGCVGGAYSNFSLDVLYSLMKEKDLSVAAHGGIDFWSTDPLRESLRIGTAVKFQSGALAVLADPYIYLGINARTSGNKDGLGIPVRLGYQASPELNVFLLTGLWGPFDGFSDLAWVPVGVGGLYSLSSRMDVGAQFIFLNRRGAGANADGRAAVLTFNYRV